MKEKGRSVIAQNRKARHDYAIIDTYEAGVALLGTEVKSLRLGRASLVDAFAIPLGWKAARILEEEPGRQGAMAARDAEVRAEAEGDQASGTSATDLQVAPAQ